MRELRNPPELSSYLNFENNFSLYGISYIELKAISCKITKDPSLQQDLIQEMYVCLLESPSGHTKSWYKQKCYWRGMDYLRSNNHNHYSLRENQITSDRNEFKMKDKMKKKYHIMQIKKIAKKILNSSNLQIFNYYFIEGLTQKEIAQKLDLTRACVAKRLERICHKIRLSSVV